MTTKTKRPDIALVQNKWQQRPVLATLAPGERQRLAFEWMVDRLEELQPNITIEDTVMKSVFPEYW